jgi:hypothetical protein
MLVGAEMPESQHQQRDSTVPMHGNPLLYERTNTHATPFSIKAHTRSHTKHSFANPDGNTACGSRKRQYMQSRADQACCMHCSRQNPAHSQRIKRLASLSQSHGVHIQIPARACVFSHGCLVLA